MTDIPTTDLDIVDPNNVLAIADADEWGDVDSGWMGEAPPTSAPVVPLLTFNAKAGQGFTDELTGDKIGEGDTLRVVWLAWSENRAYWEKPFGTGDANAQPDCRSVSMIVPDDASPNKQAETCAVCPHSQWGSGSDRTPPKCGVRFSVMLYLPDSQRITRTAFGGLAMKHVQRYLGGFSTRLPQRPPMAFVTEITVAKEVTSNGDFLVPNFRVVSDITRAEAAPLIALRDELEKQWKQLASDDLNNQDAGSTVSAAGPFDGETPFADIPSDDHIVDAEIVDGSFDDIKTAPVTAAQQAEMDDF